MNEIQEVVDELRFILQREMIEESVELTDLVAKYSTHCHEVNLRLRKCDECLRQGLRSEALHLAEASPNLLDAVAVLDFAEKDELDEIVSLYFLNTPEPLLLDVASALNQAYAEYAPLQKLLDSHRLLALARAPLAPRLNLLRSLAELDQSSPHWDSDIREMERARLRELDGESVSATRSDNLEALKTLAKELQTPSWREAIPKSLARDIKSRLNSVTSSHAERRVTALNEELHVAFAALDAVKAAELRDEWQQHRQLLSVSDSDPLVEQVAPIFSWLEAEEEKTADDRGFTKVVTQIEQALDADDVTPDELRRLKLQLDRFQRRPPGTLINRFQSRLSSLEMTERRRNFAKAGAVVAMVAVVVGSIGFFLHQYREGETSRRLVAAITQLIDEGNVSESRKLIDQHAASATSAAWLEVKNKQSAAETAESERVANWNAQIAIAKESTDLAAIEVALKTARDLVKTADEKIEVGQLQSQWQKQMNAAAIERDQKFRQLVDAAANSLLALDKKLAANDAIDASETQAALNAIAASLEKVAPLRSQVSRELNSQATLLESRFQAAQRTVADRKRKLELYDRLTDAVKLLPEHMRSAGQPDRYAEILTEFVNLFPHDPRADQMTAKAKSSPIPGAFAAQRLLKRWGQLKPTDKTETDNRLKEIREFAKEFPASPDRDLFNRYEAWLRTVQRRFEEEGDADEGIQLRTHRLFSSNFIKEGHVLQDNDGKTYYLTAPNPGPFGTLVSINYLVGFNKETKKISKSPQDLRTSSSVPAPHQEFSSKVRSTIRNVPIDQWRTYFQELVETLIKSEKVDPFLRYVLVAKLLEAAGRGDLFLEAELVSVLNVLSDSEIDRSVPWVDPNSQSAAKARKQAAEKLTKLPDLAAAFQAAQARQEEFEQAMFAPRFAIGWLDRNDVGKWSCRTKWSPVGDYVLHVAAPSDAGGTQTWSTLGSANAQSITIDPPVAQKAGEVAVVFATLASRGPKPEQSP